MKREAAPARETNPECKKFVVSGKRRGFGWKAKRCTVRFEERDHGKRQEGRHSGCGGCRCKVEPGEQASALF